MAFDLDILQGNECVSISQKNGQSVLDYAIQQFLKVLAPNEILRQASAMELCFLEALKHGLALSMLPHQSCLPTGRETGNYVVIDLGGSTLRIAVISFEDEQGEVSNLPECLKTCPDGQFSRHDRVKIVVFKQWNIDNGNKAVNTEFFSYIASKLKETLQEQTLLQLLESIVVGVTWSFPLEEISYNSAKIMLMGKGYELASDLEGADLKNILESAALETQGLRIQIEAIVNDSLTVYAAGKYYDPETQLALVLGTGFNMCYQLEPSKEFHMVKNLSGDEPILFNTEMSFFGVDLINLFITKYDLIIDPRFAQYPKFKPHMGLDPSTNTIFQPCELLSSGRYIVELTRLVILDMIKNREIFVDQESYSSIMMPYEGLPGDFILNVVENDDTIAVVSLVEKTFGWPQGLVRQDDIAKLKLVVLSIVERSSAVVSIAIIASLKTLAHCNGAFKSREVSVGYVGGVMTNLSSLRDSVTNYVNSCIDVQSLGVKIKLIHVHDSSLVGGAIAAACHVPKNNITQNKR